MIGVTKYFEIDANRVALIGLDTKTPNYEDVIFRSEFSIQIRRFFQLYKISAMNST